nr:hypothetical protein [Tanacetum cinerariifolium]
EPSYNQYYDGNYFSHELPSFLCCDNYGESHETFQCQPIAQNINFSGSDQIQTPQYPEIHSPSSETSDEVFQANHSVQNEESFDPSNEITVLNSNQGKEEPPRESDICQLIREECCVEASEKQKQSMEDTMLELVKICQEKEFLCIHDDVNYLIKSALNSKLLLINSNSQRLDKKEQEVKNVIEQPVERENLAHILSTKEPKHLLSMGYEHLSITPEMKSDEVTESNAENLLPILNKCKIDLEDISQIQDIVLREKLLSITRLIFNIESLNDNSTPDHVLNSFASDNSLSENFSPEFETFCDHSEEMRSGNTTYANYSLPEYDSFCFEIEPDQERLINLVENDILDDSLNDSLLEEADLFIFDNSIPPGIENFDNPSIPRPPPEPPDAETDVGEEITVVMNDKDEDVDYSSFIIIFDKVFSLLFAESEDTIFDPGRFRGNITWGVGVSVVYCSGEVRCTVEYPVGRRVFGGKGSYGLLGLLGV